MDMTANEVQNTDGPELCFLCHQNDWHLVDSNGSAELILKAFNLNMLLDESQSKICTACWFHMTILAEYTNENGWCESGCIWSNAMHGNIRNLADFPSNRQTMYINEVKKRYENYAFTAFAVMKKGLNRRCQDMLHRMMPPKNLTLPKPVQNDKKFFKCRVRLLYERSHIRPPYWPPLRNRTAATMAQSNTGTERTSRETSRLKEAEDDVVVIFSDTKGISPRGILFTPDRMVANQSGLASSNLKKRVSWSNKNVYIHNGDTDSSDDANDSDTIESQIPKKRKKLEKEAHPNKTSPEKLAEKLNTPKFGSNSGKTLPKSTGSSKKDDKKVVMKFKLNVPGAKRRLKMSPSKRLQPEYLRERFGAHLFRSHIKLNIIKDMASRLSLPITENVEVHNGIETIQEECMETDESTENGIDNANSKMKSPSTGLDSSDCSESHSADIFDNSAMDSVHGKCVNGFATKNDSDGITSGNESIVDMENQPDGQQTEESSQNSVVSEDRAKISEKVDSIVANLLNISTNESDVDGVDEKASVNELTDRLIGNGEAENQTGPSDEIKSESSEPDDEQFFECEATPTSPVSNSTGGYTGPKTKASLKEVSGEVLINNGTTNMFDGLVSSNSNGHSGDLTIPLTTPSNTDAVIGAITSAPLTAIKMTTTNNLDSSNQTNSTVLKGSEVPINDFSVDVLDLLADASTMVPNNDQSSLLIKNNQSVDDVLNMNDMFSNSHTTNSLAQSLSEGIEDALELLGDFNAHLPQ